MSLPQAFAASPLFFILSCAVLGLIVGSFLNVVIHRLPIMLARQWREQCAELDHGSATQDQTKVPSITGPFNLLVPRSGCPVCKTPLRAMHNVPLISYLLLRGRCASCGARISLRYPFVEGLTGCISAAVAWRFGFGWSVLFALVFSWFLVALTFIDLDEQLLPDCLTMPLLWMGILLALWAPPSAGSAFLSVDLRSSVMGAAIYQLFRLLTAKEGMGYGDFKLCAAIGAWLGWQMLLPTILLAAASGAIGGLAILWAQGKGRETPIPFGPFLAAAAWLMLLCGHELVYRYLGLFPPRA